MRIQVAVPEAHVDAPILDAALESVTRLNESMLERGEVPSLERALRYGVTWKPEPPGDEHFDDAKTVIRRKWGDCDDLAPYQAASLRHSGEDPGAKAIVRRSGPKRWHAVVQRSDGSIDDPSARAGMRAGIAPGVFGAAVPMMIGPANVGAVGAYFIRPAIAIRPFAGQAQARADLPWQWAAHARNDEPTAREWAMTALHTAPVASTALVGAIEDVVELAGASGFADPDHIDRLCAISDAIQGADWDELAGEYGPEHATAAEAVVGSFFGKIAKGLGKVVKSVAPKALQFIPGVGPVASMALEQGMKMIPSGGGGGRARAPAGAAPHIYTAPAQHFAGPSGPRPVTPAGGAATNWGRVSPQGVDLLKALIFT